MEFECEIKMPLEFVDRAVLALEEFGIWAREHTTDVLGRRTDGFDYPGLSTFELYTSPEDIHLPSYDDHFPPELVPGPGEGLMWWTDLQWPRFWSPELRQRIYACFEAYDALEVWGLILAEGERMSSRSTEVMTSFAAAHGGEFIPGGYQR